LLIVNKVNLVVVISLQPQTPLKLDTNYRKHLSAVFAIMQTWNEIQSDADDM